MTRVAPYAGAWIEIIWHKRPANCPVSLPTRERGLKYDDSTCYINIQRVAPYAGAWIEISTPYLMHISLTTSLPTRERGLK